MGRLLDIINRKQEKEKLKEFLVVIEKLKELQKREDLSDEEIRQRCEDLLNDKIVELSKIIDDHREKSQGKAWDFSEERKKPVLAEDDMIYLRAYREPDNEFIRQIKKENSSDPHIYDDDEVWKLSGEWLNYDFSLVCSILSKKDDSYIGYVSIKNTSKNLWEIAIELLASQCHKGYGTRALQLFLTKISDVTGKTQFQALVETDNVPSQLLMEKLGARLIDLYDYSFGGDETAVIEFEKQHLDDITVRMRELAAQIGVEPQEMLSHVLDYRFL